MDGVLVSPKKAAASALFLVARQEGVKVDAGRIGNALEKGNSAASIVACLMPHLCMNPGELDRVARAYTNASVENGMIEKTVIAHQLPRLAGKYRLAIATNRTEGAALGILDRLGIADFFMSVVTLADAPPKPNPHMVLLALLALGTTTAATVFVGDKPSDRKAGNAAGIRTIMVDGNEGAEGCRAFLREFGN